MNLTFFFATKEGVSEDVGLCLFSEGSFYGGEEKIPFTRIGSLLSNKVTLKTTCSFSHRV